MKTFTFSCTAGLAIEPGIVATKFDQITKGIRLGSGTGNTLDIKPHPHAVSLLAISNNGDFEDIAFVSIQKAPEDTTWQIIPKVSDNDIDKHPLIKVAGGADCSVLRLKSWTLAHGHAKSDGSFIKVLEGSHLPNGWRTISGDEPIVIATAFNQRKKDTVPVLWFDTVIVAKNDAVIEVVYQGDDRRQRIVIISMQGGKWEAQHLEMNDILAVIERCLPPAEKVST